MTPARRTAPPSTPVALVGTLALAACGGSGAGVPDEPPDVVLLVIDTQRADRLGCYGYPRPTSPRIDALAAGGILFEDATAQSSWTQPSMASLFTGRYLSRQVTAPEPDAPTLAEVFGDAGYTTLGFSANVLLAEGSGFDRGFDHFDGRPMRQEPGVPLEPRTGENLVETVMPHVAEATGEGPRDPLFLYVQFFDPHTPYLPQPQWASDLPLGPSDPEALAWQRAVYPHRRGPLPPADEGQWGAIQRFRALHDQEVREVDHWLAELVERLAARGVGENAVFALVSDHGEGLWDHVTPGADGEPRPLGPLEFFYQEHGATLYQSQLHTPLVLWGAGVPAGERVAAAVENVDLAPTLFDLAGIEGPFGLDGQNLLAVASGALAPRPFVHSVALGRAMVREVESGLTLIAIDESRKGGGLELFDLGRDPDQREDLSETRPEDVARLLARIADFNAANPTSISTTHRLTPEERRRLEELGYGEFQLDQFGAQDG